MNADLSLLHPDIGIPGFRIRYFRDDNDFKLLLKVDDSRRDIDKLDYTFTPEEIANYLKHTPNMELEKDLIFAEVDGEVVGYARTSWREEAIGDQLYAHSGQVVPEWRRRGIGSAILNVNQERLLQIARGHTGKGPKYLQSFTSEFEIGAQKILEKDGYSPVRYFHGMLKKDLNDIPNHPLPDGFEIRPVLPEHYRLIWKANEEAFQDHWGFTAYTEKEYEGWLKDPIFQPDIWRVAWLGDQVAGMVLNFIDNNENRKYDRKRGYTEDICVRRPYRGKGLAKALITESMKLHKQKGMEEVSLFVDTENWSGALGLYEGLGYKAVRTSISYRKPIE